MVGEVGPNEREPAVMIDQPSLVELAVDGIRKLILAGAVQPGERVTEDWLASRLGVSRPPIREAIQVLVQQGLLERSPRRGVRVIQLTDEDISDIYSLRLALDRFAVTLGVPVKDDKSLEPLRFAVEQMRESAASGDHASYVDANRRFHLGIIALGGNKRLYSTYESLMNQMQLSMSINLSREATHSRMEGVRRHQELLDAIQSGDIEIALAAIDAHGEQRFLDRHI